MSISVTNAPATETGAAVKVVIEGGAAGINLGQSTTSTVGFYGVTPVAQRAGAAQAAVTTTASQTTTPYGYSTSTQADAIVTLVNEMRAALVAVGIIKGAA